MVQESDQSGSFAFSNDNKEPLLSLNASVRLDETGDLGKAGTFTANHSNHCKLYNNSIILKQSTYIVDLGPRKPDSSFLTGLNDLYTIKTTMKEQTNFS